MVLRSFYIANDLEELNKPNKQHQPSSLKLSATTFQTHRKIYFHQISSIFSETLSLSLDFMGLMVQPRLLPSFILFLSFFSVLSFSSCQSNSLRNTGTPFADEFSPTSGMPGSANNPLISPAQVPAMQLPSPDQTVAKAVVGAAASTLAVAGIFFLFFQKCATARLRRRSKSEASFRREDVVIREEFKQIGGTVKGLIVDDNGLDVLYWRKLEGGQLRSTGFSKVLIDPPEEEKRVDTAGERHKKSEPIREIPVLHETSSLSTLEKRAKPISRTPTPWPSVSAPPLQPVPPRLESPCPPPPPVIPIKKTPGPPPPSVIPIKQTPAPPPPTPIPEKKILAPPPPPPPIPAKKIPAPPPPPPPMLPKRNPAPPPPPPKAGGLVSSLKPPPIPRRKLNSNSRTEDSTEENLKETVVGQMKLKPLHWDKVIANADHSMVWDEINDGSFRFDDELIETLFGYNTATNRKSPERNKSNNIPLSSGSSSSALPAQIFILEPRKSQNTAIVLRSLAISRKEILDALFDGQGLNADALEKLTKISPSQEEAAKILQFNGNPTKLADAESFLYHILKAVPSAFTRFNAMLFKSNYDPEILHLKQSLQTLELGCKELRTRGIFLKLLEAILKAGNRMNAGTARGNAQGFNLTALRKLSDVKSTDGKTTLLHFVVEQVVRAEGKRCVINRNHSLGRSNSQRSKNIDSNPDSLTATQEERDKEYLMLGLPVLGSLSVEFSNVKKAATIDYDSFINICSSLTAHVTEIQQLVTRCSNGERGGFVRQMKGFLEECKEELKVVREEQTRVMELVRRTTEYYQAGASKDKAVHPLQLFVIVKDFLDMVDQVCQDITRKLQKKNMTKSVGLSPPSSPPTMNLVRFPNLWPHFTSDKKSRTTSFSDSDSEDEF